MPAGLVVVGLVYVGVFHAVDGRYRIRAGIGGQAPAAEEHPIQVAQDHLGPPAALATTLTSSGPSPCDHMVSKARSPARKISFSPVTDFNLL